MIVNTPDLAPFREKGKVVYVNKACEDIAEIAGGYREIDLVRPNACGNLERGMDIVDDLGHDPGPVDGIHARKAHTVAENVVVEQGLENCLAVIKIAFNDF